MEAAVSLVKIVLSADSRRARGRPADIAFAFSFTALHGIRTTQVTHVQNMQTN